MSDEIIKNIVVRDLPFHHQEILQFEPINVAQPPAIFYSVCRKQTMINSLRN